MVKCLKVQHKCLNMSSNSSHCDNCFAFFLVEELVPRGSRPARPVSIPAPEMRERTDSGSQSASPGKGMKSIKGKLMARPRTRSRVDYDELAQVCNFNVALFFVQKSALTFSLLPKKCLV